MMFKRLLFWGALVGSGMMPLQAQQITKEGQRRAEEMVNKMTLEEKVSLLSGATSFSLRTIPRMGIPTILLADGPVGLRNHSPHSTLYPASVLSAATWNRTLFRQLGSSLGDDARARGVGILLGPGVNIYRSPLCGRNYEYFGEDPYLTSEIACEYIKGVQSKGVIATIKHFAGNNQEWNRHHVNSEIDRRTLHEIYFPAFRAAVKKAGVGAFMDSYNLLNGVHATENAWLNRDVLRREWGFKGILMSDWTSVYSTIAVANNGLDLEMPKGKFLNMDNLKEALANGTVDERVIDEKVRHILQTVISFGIFDREQKDTTIAFDHPQSVQTALDLAREGIVLLRNENQVLPLQGVTALMGTNATEVTTGGGSGNVEPYHSTSLRKALISQRPQTILLTDDVIFDNIQSEIYTDSTMTEQGFKGEYYNNKVLRGEPFATRIDAKVDFDWQYGRVMKGMPTDTFSVRWKGYYKPRKNETLKVYIGGDDGYRIRVNGRQVAADWGNHAYSYREKTLDLVAGQGYQLEVEYFDNISSANIKLTLQRLNEERLQDGLRKASNVVYAVGFNSSIEGEGFDRPFVLPEFQRQMIRKVAAVNPNTVVVINAGGGVEMDSWLDAAKGVVMAWYPGQEGGTALAEILTGKLSPSGRLPISIERRLEDNPCAVNYQQNTTARELKTVEYREGVFVGYRGYEHFGVKPLFPFGFGLSYTSFAYSDLKVRKVSGGQVEVSFTITNTGSMEAKEVAQVYVAEQHPVVVRPTKELKGFEKVSLQPGESKRVKVVLDAEAFMYYDVISETFRMQPGVFRILVGRSSADIVLSAEIKL